MDPTQARIEREFKHTSPLMGCRFDPSGRFLFLSAQDNTIQRIDLITGKKIAITGHQSWLRGMAFVPGPAPATPPPKPIPPETRTGAAAVLGGFVLVPPTPPPTPFTLISGDYHGKLIWRQGEVANPTPIRTVEAHDGWIRAVAVSPDGKTVASCGNDQHVKLWSAEDGKPIRILEGHTCHVYNVAFHPTEANRLVSADLKGIVKDWDWQKGTVVREMDAKVFHKFDGGFMADIGGVRGMAFNATGTMLSCAGITNVSNAFAGVGNPLVVLFDWKEGKPKQIKPKDAFQGTAWGTAFHPEGFVIAAGGGGQGRIWFWKGEEAVSFHTVTVPSNARDMALSPDGARIATACFDGTARIYTLIPATKK